MSEPTTHDNAPTLRVAIAGGGIGGLITAIALLQHPHVTVQVYERAPSLTEIGASIALGPNGLSSLAKLGVHNVFADDVSYRQKSGLPMIYRHWKTGEVIDHDTHRHVADEKLSTTRFHRAHLHQALYENLPQGVVQFGKRTVDVKVTPEGAKLVFEDGTVAEADVVIGADGIHSVVRKTFVPSHSLKWTGWVALRTVYEQSRLDGVEYPEDATHWVGPDRNMFHSPLGKGLFTIVGGYHGDPSDPNAPGQDVKWDDTGDVEKLRDIYKDWHPSIRAFTQAAPSVRQFPNFAGPPLPTWSFGDRVTLIGDAAHTHGGAFAAGGSLAINDAHALALALSHVWPPSATKTPTREQLRGVFELYEATRKSHVDRLLAVVAARKSPGENETDEQLRARVLGRMDPTWIAEHDVEAAFWEAVGRLAGVDGSAREVGQSRL